MTDETKKLFDAPWKVWGDGCQVCDIRGIDRAYCEDIKDSARLARLPELYDALMEAVKEDCRLVAHYGLFYCKACDISDGCKVRKRVELLLKVRYGK